MAFLGSCCSNIRPLPHLTLSGSQPQRIILVLLAKFLWTLSLCFGMADREI